MKETIRRTWRTFVQVACGVVTTGIVTIMQGDISDTTYLSNALKGLLICAISTALATVMNLPQKEKK